MTTTTTTRSITLSQNMIDAFADITGDRQWIHVDVDRAAQSPFGGTIAHGMLVASLVPTVVGELVDADPEVIAFDRECGGIGAVINLGFGHLAFASPVRSGTVISAQVNRVDTEPAPGALDVCAEFVVWVHLSRPRIAAAGNLRLRYTAGP